METLDFFHLSAGGCGVTRKVFEIMSDMEKVDGHSLYQREV